MNEIRTSVDGIWLFLKDFLNPFPTPIQWFVLILAFLFPFFYISTWKWMAFSSSSSSSSSNLINKRGNSRTIPINSKVFYAYGFSEMQGKRPYMEDRHVAVHELHGDISHSFYAVFDGHGGDGAAEYCVEKLCTNILSHMTKPQEDPIPALRQGFIRTDEEYVQLANVHNRDDGTTVIAAYVKGNDVFVANVGDSRAVLVKKSGQTLALSVDHKPNRPDEKHRISSLGGAVVFWGVWRVEGILAVSRAIGDRMLKHLVVGEPEIQKYSFQYEEDQFLLLASDGVWDTISNDEAASIAIESSDAQMASQRIMEEAYRRGSMDNISIMVIDLRKPRNPNTKSNNSEST